MNMIRRKFLQSTKKSPSGNYIFLEPNENIQLRREEENEDIAIGDKITVEELVFGKVSIRAIKIDNFNLFPYKFFGNNVLEEVEITNFYIEDGNTFSYNFANCNNLKTVYLSAKENNFQVNFTYLFRNCQNLEKVAIFAFELGSMIYPFQNCFNLKEVVLGFEYVYNTMQNLWKECSVKIARFPNLVSAETMSQHFKDSTIQFIYMPLVDDYDAYLLDSVNELRAVVFPADKLYDRTITTSLWYPDTKIGFGQNAGNFYYCHFLGKFINGEAHDIDLSLWNPINALSESSDLVEWQEWDLEADGKTHIDCTQFQNNKEKFLYCFRNLTLPAFEDTTGITKNLTFSQEMYDVLSQEQDIMDFFTQNNWNVSVPQ